MPNLTRLSFIKIYKSDATFLEALLMVRHCNEKTSHECAFPEKSIFRGATCSKIRPILTREANCSFRLFLALYEQEIIETMNR